MDIVNIVMSLVFDCTFDLTDIVKEFEGELDLHTNFNALNIRLRKKSFCQIFPNGKCIINGIRSLEESSELISAYQRALRDMGYSANIVSSRVVNIIATYNHGKPLPLFELAKKNRLWLEPEIFPAARVRMEDLKITVNIFHSGKCMILGAKSEALLVECGTRLQDLLKSIQLGA